MSEPTTEKKVAQRRLGRGDWLEVRASLPHLLSFVIVAGVALAFQYLITPAGRPLAAPSAPECWSSGDLERFSVAIHLWAALAVAASVSVLLLITYSLGVIWCESGRRWFSVLLLLIVSFTVFCYLADAGSSSSNLSFHEKKIVGFPIEWLTKPLNALVGAAVASLFAAGAALSIRVTVERTRDAGMRAGSSLRTLVLVGAISTVLGMLSIGALHRLPGAAVTGAKLDEPAREAAWGHVESLLDYKPKADEAHPALPFVARWIVASTHMTEPEATAISASLIEKAKADPDFKAWALSPRDETARSAQAKALDGIAAATASWWGLVFATTLVIVYVLGVVAIAPVAELSGAKAFSLATEGEKGGRWDVLIRVLTALAPLLTAGLTEAVRKVLEFLQPGTA
jgi:hypothetical protein